MNQKEQENIFNDQGQKMDTNQANDNYLSKKLEALNQYLNVKQLQESMDLGREYISYVEGQDAIMVLGNTGVGKSTTICYLCGAEMIEKEIDVQYKNDDGELIATKRKVIDSMEPFESFVIGHRQASETSFINVIQIQDKADLVICDVPGFEDSRGAAIDLSNTLCLNEAIQSTKKLRIVLLFKFQELEAQRGKLIRDILKLISGCFKEGKFEENITKIQVHYTHAGGKSLEHDILPILIAVQNEIKPEEAKARALLDHIIKLASPKTEQTAEEDKKASKKPGKIQVRRQGMVFKSMIIDPLNQSQRAELLNMICEPKQVQFENPAEILEFKPNELTYNQVKLFIQSIQAMVAEFMNQKKYDLAFQVLEKTQIVKTYIKLQEVTDSISEICQAIKSILFTKQNNIRNTIQQTLVSNGKFYHKNLEDIEDYIQLIKLWDEKKESYFEAKEVEQLSLDLFNQTICKIVKEYSDGQLENVGNYQINDQIGFFSSFYDQLENLNPYFDKLAEIKKQFVDTLGDVIHQYEDQCQSQTDTFLKLVSVKHDENAEENASESSQKTDQLDQILVSFDILLLWQEKFTFLNESYKKIYTNQKKYFEDQLRVVSEKMQTELKKLVSGLQDQINNQSSTKMEQISCNNLQSRMYLFQIMSGNRKITKLFPELTKVYVDLIKESNLQIKQFLETLTEKLQKHLKSQQLHQWKSYLNEIDNLKNLVSHQIKSLKQQNLEDIGSDDIDKKYMQFKSRLLNKVNDIVEEINHYTMILQNSDSEQDVFQLIKQPDKTDACQQQNLQQSKVNIDQIQNRPTITRLFKKLQNKIAVIKNLDWMDSYFDTDTVSRSLRKAERRVVSYLESVVQKIGNLIPSLNAEAAIWHQIADYYFQIVKMKKFGESIKDVDTQVTECQRMIALQLDNLEKDCQSLLNELQNCSLNDYQLMKKLNFKIEQLKYITEFAGIDTIAGKVLPYLPQLQEGWQKQIITTYNDIRKISDGSEFYKKNSEDLEQMNGQLDMFQSMQEFKELNDIQLPNMNRNFSIYQNLINILKECCTDLAKIKQQHIFNKKIEDVEKIDKFFRQSFKTLRNHLPDLSECIVDFNELSKKISGEIETYFKERKWQQIADFIKQNVQISNMQLSSQIEIVKQNIIGLHDTEFESLEGTIHHLRQNELDSKIQETLTRKVRLITDLKKHFAHILDKEFYKEKEKQLYDTMVNWMKKLQENIEYTRSQKKFIQMNQYQMRYMRVLECFERSFLWTKESENLKNLFEISFKDSFMKQEIDYRANYFMKSLEELKQIIDQSSTTDVKLLQIYSDKLEKIVQSIQTDITKKEENVSKLIKDGLFKEAEREVAGIKLITKKFETYITYDNINVQDMQDQLKDHYENTINSLLDKFDNLEDPKSIEELNNEIKKKYNRANNPQIYESLKQNYDKIYSLHLQNLTQLLKSSILSYDEITVGLQKLTNLSKINSICEDVHRYESKLLDAYRQILNKLNMQLNQTNQKVKNNAELSEQEIIDFCSGLKMINKIQSNKQLQSETKTLTQIKQCSVQINQTLSLQIKNAYYTFKINLDNLRIFELQKSLQELKKLNPIISFIKNTDEIQLKELELSDELIAYKKSDDIQTFKVAEEQVDKVINGLEKDSREHFENKEYGKLGKKLKSIKELQTLNPSSDNQYERFVNELTQHLKTLAEKMTEKIVNEIFDKELQEMFSQLEKMGAQMNDVPDIGVMVEKTKAHSMGMVKKKLEQTQNQFKASSQEGASAQGEMLIKIAKFCDDVPIIKKEVDQTLKVCMDHVASDVQHREEKIGDLWDYFQQKNDDIGNQIVTTIPHFVQQNQTDRMNKTKATHNPEYVLSRFKLLSDSDNSFNSEQKQMFQEKKFAFLKQEQKDQLEKMYNNYMKRYTDLIEIYTIKKFGQKKEILDQIKKNIEFKYQIENWNDNCKKQMNDLFAMASAYWSLMGIKDEDGSFNKKTILKSPHASQIFSIMFLMGFDKTDAWLIGGTRFSKTSFDNQLIQILTGEGKSIILGLLSTLLALVGYNVDVACYSKYLSQRDYEDFLPLFKELGIEKKVSYGTFCDLSEKIINRAGDLREMSQNLLRGQQNKVGGESKAKSILLIDEVDVFFSSDFYGQTYNPATLFQHPHLAYIMETLWKNQVLKNVNLSVDQIKQSTQYKELIQQYPKFERFFQVHIRMMAQAIDKIGEHKYEVVNGKIGYKMGASGDSISTDVYYGYSTNFAYFQEFDRGNVSEEEKKKQIGINLQCGYYSYADAPKKYLKILGVTGTLETLHEESLRIISQYIQAMSAVPSQFGDSRFKFDKAADIKAAMDEENMFLTLAQMIDKGLQDLRPVLVFFRDTETLYRFYKSQHCKKQDIIIIEPKSENIANLVVKSTRKKQLVLLDRVFGRGTDFQCLDKTIDEKGGILVIQTFFSLDKSEEQQIKGRTARQSRNGQYQLIVNAKDLEEDFHIKTEETQQYKESISTIYDQLLDKKRFTEWGEQLKKLTESIVEADKKHKITEKYLELLTQNKNDEATQMLIQFNFNAIKPDKTSAYHFIFCLDDSGSMTCTDGTPKTRWQKVVDAIQSFVQERDNSTNGMSQDIVSIIYHESNSIAICKYTPITNVMTAINQNRPRWGGNSFYKAVQLTQQIITGEPETHKGNSKIVIFLSDGGDCDSNTHLVNSINQLIAMNNANAGKIVSWWNMGFGPGAEAGVLKQMSQLLAGCGGKYVTALNAAEIQAKFNEIAQPEAIIMK